MSGTVTAGRPQLAVKVRRLGRMGWRDALRVQEAALAERLRGSGPDLLFLLEHPPVLTLGRNSRGEHLLVPVSELERLGVELHEAGRGGDVTYHGPGQLVGYPVLGLPPGRQDVKAYVRDLEEVMIRAVEDFGIRAAREPGLPGIWVGRDKLGAIGVRLTRWVTSHGFALNVAPDLGMFRLITPCGLVGRGVTSLERCLGEAPSLAAVTERVAARFQEVFGGAP